MQKTMDTELSHYTKEHHLEALLLARKMRAGFTTDDIWMNKKMCSDTRESSRSSRRRVSFFNDALNAFNDLKSK